MKKLTRKNKKTYTKSKTQKFNYLIHNGYCI